MSFEVVSVLGSTGAIASLIASIVGYLLAKTAKKGASLALSEISVEKIENEKDPLHNVIEKQLNDAKKLLECQRTYYQKNVWSMNSLVIGQYLVGGVLASSFLQEVLTPNLIGGLGLLVLSSSLIQQKFRPDIQVMGAKGRIQSLSSLLRSTEIQLAALKAGEEGAMSAYDIAQYLSKRLDEIEKSEQVDFGKVLTERDA